MTITCNANVTAANLNGQAGRVPRATAAGVRRVGEHVKNIESRQVKKIYQRAIPTKKQVAAFNRTGKRPARTGGRGGKAWERTGQLLEGVSLAASGSNAVVGIAGPAAAYAHPRHQLGVSRIPARPALGIVRINPFADQTMQIVSPQVERLFTDEFWKELER